MIYELWFDFPNSTNTHWRKGKHTTYISKKGLEYTETIKRQLKDQLGDYDTIDYRITVSLLFFPKDKRTRDIDNYFKSLFDSLTKAKFIEDDKLIRRIIDCEMLDKQEDIKNKIRLRIYEYEQRHS